MVDRISYRPSAGMIAIAPAFPAWYLSAFRAQVQATNASRNLGTGSVNDGMAMKTNTRLAVCLSVYVSLLIPGLAVAATPPIACKKVSTAVDRTICASPDLLAMDREIAALYDRGLAELSIDDRHKLAQSQLAFLKQRSGCAWAAHNSAHPGPAVNECIRDKMETRIRALRTTVDRKGLGGRWRTPDLLDEPFMGAPPAASLLICFASIDRPAGWPKSQNENDQDQKHDRDHHLNHPEIGRVRSNEISGHWTCSEEQSAKQPRNHSGLPDPTVKGNSAITKILRGSFFR
jgi:uncharacterized protein YecT (DUF1311 family)